MIADFDDRFEILAADVYFVHVYHPLEKGDTADPALCQIVAELVVPVVAAAGPVAAKVPFVGSVVVPAEQNFAGDAQLEAAAVANSASADYAEPAGNTAVAGNIATSGMHTLASFGGTVGFPD